MPPPHLPVEAESKSRRLLSIVTVEDDADVCPKVSGSTAMDTALRAQRRTGPGVGTSPYAKPMKQGKGLPP